MHKCSCEQALTTRASRTPNDAHSQRHHERVIRKGTTYPTANMSVHRIHNVSGRVEKTFVVEDELEVIFSFKESIVVLNPYHDVQVISLGITSCLIKRIHVYNDFLVNIIYADTLKEIQVEEIKITRRAMVLGASAVKRNICWVRLICQSWPKV